MSTSGIMKQNFILWVGRYTRNSAVEIKDYLNNMFVYEPWMLWGK